MKKILKYIISIVIQEARVLGFLKMTIVPSVLWGLAFACPHWGTAPWCSNEKTWFWGTLTVSATLFIVYSLGKRAYLLEEDRKPKLDVRLSVMGADVKFGDKDSGAHYVLEIFNPTLAQIEDIKVMLASICLSTDEKSGYPHINRVLPIDVGGKDGLPFSLNSKESKFISLATLVPRGKGAVFDFGGNYKMPSDRRYVSKLKISAKTSHTETREVAFYSVPKEAGDTMYFCHLIET